MDAWGDIRLIARECHRLALLGANGDRRGRALVDASLKLADLHISYYDPGAKGGGGVYGFLEREAGVVNVARQQAPADEIVVVAHEIGHFNLHKDPRNEVTNVQSSLGGDPIDSGAGRVEGYSPRERKEVQADVFAGEFLCPADWLKQEVVAGGKRPSQVATELGLPQGLVLNQAIRALLLPPLSTPTPETTGASYELDDSQKKAATWDGGPILVDAGPGTGKTRTLVHRVGHILDHGATSGSILALTFSKKAAEEMRERLSLSHAEEAIEMWVGTFHAFGSELLTKWPGRIGRTSNVRILDQTGTLALLEANLSRLPLRHYQNLYEPAYELVHVLQAISRCKDEMIGPDEYLAEAQAALADAPESDREGAEKAVEVGEIYKVYQEVLEAADAVDFGDLVMLAAKVLQENDDVRAEYQSRFEHILVDEYQDVNFASAKLLQALAGACRDVWVVADQRQSIYRFRGAQPSNVARFEGEFSGTTHSLAHNYRSGAAVVRTFEAFTKAMTGGQAASWIAERGAIGTVSLTVGATMADEAIAIRDQIEALRAKGVPYRDQVILARSHLTLARITDLLEKLGVPLLYLGDVFERDEVRDLLSLVAMDAEFGNIGLVRVAQLPEYGASKGDALAVLKWAQANKVTVFDALARVGEIDCLSAVGVQGLARLGSQLAGMGPETSPWTLLTTWLFERSQYLTPLLSADDAKSRQKLVAIYQLLKVCGEFATIGRSKRKQFLARVRRIEALNQDSIYRAVASEATDFDAVRVMTIHGSKGLEFGAVHLPALATRYMPSNRQGNRCPAPPEMSHLAMDKDDHDAEEQCLFFVALSRARDYLCLSRAERYTQVNATPSKFLASLTGLPSTRRQGQSEIAEPEPILSPPGARATYEERELSLYMRCPARYRYEVIDGLRGASDESAYLGFHRCVYRTIGWLERRRKEGAPATQAEALVQLDNEWASSGPIGHGFEEYYRSAANNMVVTMAAVIAGEASDYDRDTWSVAVNEHMVELTPDRALIDSHGNVCIQRIRTGKQSKSEPENRIYALMRKGAAARYPDRSVSVATFYPASGEAVPTSAAKDGKSLGEYADAIAGIERGEFVAKPKDPRQCPNCQCYFICGI